MGTTYIMTLAKVSDPTLYVRVSLGSYGRMFIDIKETTSEMCPLTMMSNSSCVVSLWRR
jgi:hypothetical protein